MILIDCVQGSPNWRKARLGRPTASRFDQIITPAKLQPAKSAENYLYQLLAEWIIGQPCDSFNSQILERGSELEEQARKAYEFQTDRKVTQVGFCTTDDGLIGCSPDGLIGDDGGLEIKCPMAPGHVEYLLDSNALYQKYRLQVQGALYVTGRAWWDIISYNPQMPLVIVRIGPEAGVQAALADYLDIFTKQLEIYKQRLIERGIEPYAEEVDEELDALFPA